jgi:hypothetical protein
MPISLGDISQYIIRLLQVPLSITQFHQIASNCRRVHDMNDHDENEVEFDLIENVLSQSFSDSKAKLIDFN